MQEGMGATEDAAARRVLAGQKQAFIPWRGTDPRIDSGPWRTRSNGPRS